MSEGSGDIAQTPAANIADALFSGLMKSSPAAQVCFEENCVI